MSYIMLSTPKPGLRADTHNFTTNPKPQPTLPSFESRISTPSSVKEDATRKGNLDQEDPNEVLVIPMRLPIFSEITPVTRRELRPIQPVRVWCTETNLCRLLCRLSRRHRRTIRIPERAIRSSVRQRMTFLSSAAFSIHCPTIPEELPISRRR